MNLVKISDRVKLERKRDDRAYFVSIDKGVHLGYRPRAQSAGAWFLRVTKGGADWTITLGTADDRAPADDKTILSYAQATQRGLAMARAGRAGAPSVTRPATVAEAIDAYQASLAARRKSIRNAKTARAALAGSSILAKPVGQLERAELQAWRDQLAAKVSPATVNRIATTIKAALSLAASNDRERIASTFAWTDGLKPLPDAHNSAHHVITEEDTRRLVHAAREDSIALGLLVELAAVTGARFSQLARIEVRDLDVAAAVVSVPSSNKGRGKKRPAQPLPIAQGLAKRLAEAAAGRAPGDMLLAKQRGSAWLEGDQAEPMARLANQLALRDDDGELVTMGALRHSSITRQLLANTPIRVVAQLHDTSAVMIERTYSRSIGRRGADLFRRAQIDIGANLRVVA